MRTIPLVLVVALMATVPLYADEPDEPDEPARPADAAPAAPALRLRPLIVTDPQVNNTEAFRMLIPVGWKHEGGIAGFPPGSNYLGNIVAEPMTPAQYVSQALMPNFRGAVAGSGEGVQAAGLTGSSGGRAAVRAKVFCVRRLTSAKCSPIVRERGWAA